MLECNGEIIGSCSRGVLNGELFPGKSWVKSNHEGVGLACKAHGRSSAEISSRWVSGRNGESKLRAFGTGTEEARQNLARSESATACSTASL